MRCAFYHPLLLCQVERISEFFLLLACASDLLLKARDERDKLLAARWARITEWQRLGLAHLCLRRFFHRLEYLPCTGMPSCRCARIDVGDTITWHRRQLFVIAMDGVPMHWRTNSIKSFAFRSLRVNECVVKVVIHPVDA